VERENTGCIDIEYFDLPFDVAFSVSYVDEDGKENRYNPGNERQAVRIRRSTAGNLQLDCSIGELGTNKVVFVLRPSIEGAYYDPEIKEIWNGTLQFPATITARNASK